MGTRTTPRNAIPPVALGLLLVVAALIASPGGAQAQTPPPATATASANPTPGPETGDEELGVGLFPWAFEDGGFSGNYLRGLVLFLLGTVGALIAVYSTLGDFLPSMGRGAYDLQKAEVDEQRRARDEVLRQRKAYADRGEAPPPDLAELSDDYIALVAQGDQSLGRLRWRLIGMAVPLYVLLGGFVAAAIATSLTLALAVGFGWTAVLDRIGLGRELAKTTPQRAEAVEQLQRETSSARAESDAVVDENARLATDLDAAAARYNDLAERYLVAQRALRDLALVSEDVGEADGGGDG